MGKIKDSLPMQGMSMEVQIRRRYGRVLVYPICMLSKGLLALTGKKTWTKDALGTLECLGLDIEYIPESVNLELLGVHSE